MILVHGRERPRHAPEAHACNFQIPPDVVVKSSVLDIICYAVCASLWPVTLPSMAYRRNIKDHTAPNIAAISKPGIFAIVSIITTFFA